MNIPGFSWRELGPAYQAFSALSDEGDWQALMAQLASIIASNAKRTRTILDYGAGLGTTAASIRRRMYGDHGVSSEWKLYEPDSWARRASAFVMPSLGDSMDVVTSDSVPNTTCDVALFSHTAYYIENFVDVLEQLFRDVLVGEDARAICLVMPEESPFFIDELGNRHYWTAERILAESNVRGFKSDVVKMRSRFRLLKHVAGDQELLRLIGKFVVGHEDVGDDHLELVKRNLLGEVDFGDWIVVLRR